MLKSKKLLSLILTLVMVVSLFTLSVSASALDSGYTVTIYVQEAARDVDDNIEYSYVWTDTPIVVPVESGSTLKEAIQAAASQGQIISNDEWYDNNGNPDTEWLSSLTLTEYDLTYTNENNFYYDYPEPGLATYEGFSWMYFNGTPDDMPSSAYAYPSVSLGSQTVTGNVTITLSFEYLTYVWEY